jgi:glycosyltransferase involved in cell wall biosynthesis
MKPSVSVVIASYNYGRYIGEALASVRAQTFSDWEAIVVDDGSTDETLAVVRPVLADPRFRLVRQDHGGQPRAKNRGIDESRGTFVAFLDADDRWRPAKLARQLERFAANRDLGVCQTRRTIIDADGRPASGDDRTVFRGDVLDPMYRRNFVCFSTVMLRRRVFEHVGTFDERIGLAIDYDWWLRVARFYPFDCVEEPLVEYRVGHANLSRRVADRLDTALVIMDRFRRCFDVPARLNAGEARRGLAETYRNRGIVGRRDPADALGWLMRAAALRPTDFGTWRGLAAAMTPAVLRRLSRRLRGQSADWDDALAPAASEVV